MQTESPPNTKAKPLGIQAANEQAAEDRAKNVALAAWKADRAESAAYHAAILAADGSYVAAGGQWDALGLARLCAAGLAVALKSFRTADRLAPEAWRELHGDLVAAALGKAAEPRRCTFPGCAALAAWETPGPLALASCLAHRPTVKVHRPAAAPASHVGQGYWEATAHEDADGNIVQGRRFIPARLAAKAPATVYVGRRLEQAGRLPRVGQINVTWSTERAKGMLADYWSGDRSIPTDAEHLAEHEDAMPEAYGKGLTWRDLAEHLPIDGWAERAALAVALEGLTVDEVGMAATVYGAAKPVSGGTNGAAKSALQRARKALAERLTPEDVTKAIDLALGDAERQEAASPEAIEVLAPLALANVKVPAWEARLDLAAHLNPAALRSAFLARHIWPRLATKAQAAPLAPRRVVLRPAIGTSNGRRVLVLHPAWQDTKATHLANLAARKARRLALANKVTTDAEHLAAWLAAWDKVDETEQAWQDVRPNPAACTTYLAALAAARDLSAHYQGRRTVALPTWPASQREAYLAHLPTGRRLAPTERPYPTQDTERHARTESLLAALTQERAAEQRAAASRTTTKAAGTDLVEAWRMAGPAGPLDARPLTQAEQAEQAAALAAFAARLALLPDAERLVWLTRADASKRRAARRLARKAKA